MSTDICTIIWRKIKRSIFFFFFPEKKKKVHLVAAANATARAAVASSIFFLFLSSTSCFSAMARASCSAFSLFSSWEMVCLSFCLAWMALWSLKCNIGREMKHGPCGLFVYVSFIQLLPLYPTKAHRGDGAYPSGQWAKAGCTPGESPVHHGADRGKQPNTLTLTPMGNLEFPSNPINLTWMSLDCGRKPENLGGTHTVTEGTCKLHKEKPRPGI